MANLTESKIHAELSDKYNIYKWKLPTQTLPNQVNHEQIKAFKQKIADDNNSKHITLMIIL